MKKLLLIGSIILIQNVFSNGQSKINSENFILTAHVGIDTTRKAVRDIATDKNNYIHRLNILNNWTRLLAFAGADIGGYLGFREQIREFKNNPNQDLFEAIDQAFYGLERVYVDFKMTPEGQEFRPRSTYERYENDWALFHENNQNTGMTDDPGPVDGQLAWKFPTGRPWYSRPAVEDGKVYAVSPGMTTILYCLNEEDGSVNWKATQRGSGHQYGTARMNSSVLLLEDVAIIREVGSGGNKGHQKHFVYVDKETGKKVKEVVAGHIDYRVGYAPLDGNEDYLVYPHGVQTIHWAKDRTITTFDSVMCKDPETTETLWKYYVGEYWTEPLLDNEQVFAGTADGKVYALNANKNQERVVWQYNAGESVNSKLAVSGNIVIAGSNDGIIHGIDRKTGKNLWKFEIDDPETRAFQQFSAAEINYKHVLIGGADKYLYSLNLQNGQLNWKKNLSDWIRAKPLVMGNHVYAATLDGKLYKMNNKTGSVEWIRQPSGHQIFADLVAGNNKIFLNSSDLYLHCLDAETGQELWRQSLMEAVYDDNERIWADFDGGGGDFQSPPIVAEGMVFAGGPARFIHALDHETGKEIWRFEVRGQIPAAPVFSDGKIYFGQQGGTSNYYCINAYTGELVWKKELGWGWASANVNEGKVYIPTVSGWIYCLNAENGETIWEYNTENGTYPAPAIEGNVVVFGSWNDKYYGFDKNTGEQLWVKSIDGNPDSGAALVKDGKAYLQGLAADFFFCVDLETGEEIWKFPLPDGYECNMSPSISNGKVFFSAFRGGEVCITPLPGITYCVDADTGEKIWELNGGGGLTGTANAQGKVYFASTNDPYIWCVDEKGNRDGSTKVYWKFKMNGRAEESCVAIAYGKVYVLATDGYVYAIE